MTNKKTHPANNIAMLLLFIASVIFLKIGYISNESWYGGLIVSLPLLFFFALDARLHSRRKENSRSTGFDIRKPLAGTADHDKLVEGDTPAFIRKLNEQSIPMPGHRFFKRSRTQYNKIIN